jgi:hypothetical protein
VKHWGWSFDAERSPLCRSSPNPKRSFGEEERQQNKYARTNFQQQQQARKTQGFIPRFNSPLKLVYVLVVEVTTKVGVSFTSLPLSKQPQRSLEFSTKKSRVIQTSQGSSTGWKLLGDA